MRKLERQERKAKLVRYNLISLFYFILIVAITLIIAFNWNFIVELTPVLSAMLTFGV